MKNIQAYTNIYKFQFLCKYKVQGAYLHEEDYEKVKKELHEIFNDNHHYYCILAEHILDVAKEVLIGYNTKAELLTNHSL